MDKIIKIYEQHGKFLFSVNKFSSREHNHLTKYAKCDYKFAWEAQRDARELAKHDYHIRSLERVAFEDLSKPVIDDVAAERKLADHYTDVYDGLVDIASGTDDHEKVQKKINYFEAKSIVQEILFIIEKLPEDELASEQEIQESEVRLRKIIKKISKLVNSNYKEELIEDKKKSEEQSPEMEMPMAEEGLSLASSSNRVMRFAKNESVIDDEEFSELKKELNAEYGTKSCSALEKKHPKVTWMASENNIDLMIDGEKVLNLLVGDDLFLEDVRPVGSFQKIYPYNSLKFYQSYWKPIVEAIGHCCIGDNTYLLNVVDKSLPDIPKSFPSKSSSYQAISKDSKMPLDFLVSFRGDPASWFIDECKVKVASARYSKEEYYNNGKGAIIVCTDPKLKTYYQKTGQVIQVIPFDQHLEVDVDFGNSVFRMVESQFDILNDI
jgi:hypothetical protein